MGRVRIAATRPIAAAGHPRRSARNRVNKWNDRIPFGRLAVIGTIGSVATCYSRILFLELVWLGESAPPEINPHVQAAVMTAFALLALVGLFLDRRRHESSIPLVVGLTGVLIIVGTLYVRYRADVEFTGYLVLIVAVFLNQNVQLKRLNRAVEALNIELTERAREAQQATGAKSRFLANMSHELRTPLNAIIGISEMLHEDAVEEGSADVDSHARIVAAGRHLLALVDDILDLSKVEAGRLELESEAVGVAALMNEIEMTVRPLAERNRNVLEITLDGTVDAVRGDPLRIRQVVLNLASNACKFTESGRVSISVDGFRDAAGEWVRFVVSDTGIGIDADRIGSIFDEFSQAQSPGSKYGGTGLGLAISQRLCNVMGGEIVAESTSGSGSTFTVRLPRAHQASGDESRDRDGQRAYVATNSRREAEPARAKSE